MSDPSLHLFRSPDRRFSVEIGTAAIQTMLAACIKAGRKETGGILIGKIDPSGRVAHVLEATPKPRDSAFGWFWFKRGTHGLKQLLAHRWSVGQHYLGEWHFHPGGSPEPSAPDCIAMAQIASDARYQCKEPILLILGGTPPHRWEISATVYPASEPHQRLCRVPQSDL